MKTAYKIIVCIAAISLLFTSCAQSSKRINDLTIVQALAVDSHGNKCEINIQYLNLFANSGTTEDFSKNITSITRGSGENISQAVFTASKTVSNDVFFGQNKLVILGADFAAGSIDEGIEYLLKSAESRPDVPVAIGIPDAETIIKSKENDAQIPAENIYSLIRLGEETGHAPHVTVCDLMNLYNDETSDIFLPVLSCEKDTVKCEGTAIFSKNKLVSMLSEDETFGFLIAKNRFQSGVLTFSAENAGRVSVNILSSKAKKSVEIKNGKMIFNIKIKTEIQIDETGKTIKKPLTNSDFKMIQKGFEKKIENLCTEAVKKCFIKQSDPFMTARYLYFEDRNLYNALKDDWRSHLDEAVIITQADSSLQRIVNNTAQ